MIGWEAVGADADGCPRWQELAKAAHEVIGLGRLVLVFHFGIDDVSVKAQAADTVDGDVSFPTGLPYT